MPSYQDALSADPAEFIGCAAQMSGAAADLMSQQTDYGSKVAEINGHWRDTANDAFNGEVGTVNTHLAQVIGEITATAGSLAATGAKMVTECLLLKLADTSLQVAGFNILPAPQVVLGPAQRAAVAASGPFGAHFEAAFQLQAAAGTLGLKSLHGLINASDAVAGAALSQAADLLKPLEDKASPGADPGSNAAADDHSGGAGGNGGEDPASEEEEQSKEEEKPEVEQQQDPGQPDSQQPTTPETPSGMEDLAPETPDMENPWDASELGDPDDLAGGLASGGGLGAGGAGGGLGTGGLSAGAGSVPQGGMGTGVPSAVPGAGAPGAGAKAGSVGMMGAGGGRGAGGKTDDEVTRESILTEDPDEDVWGIGSEDDPYA